MKKLLLICSAIAGLAIWQANAGLTGPAHNGAMASQQGSKVDNATGTHLKGGSDIGNASQCNTSSGVTHTWTTVTTGAGCPTGYAKPTGPATVEGQDCCYKTSGDDAVAQAQLSGGVKDVFAPKFTDLYWGWDDSSKSQRAPTLKSPSAGRGNSYQAHLDACLSSTDVDAIDSNYTNDSDRYNACAGSSYCLTTAHNGHCQDTVSVNGSSTADGVCVNDCACYYTGAGVTCDSSHNF